jgi:hypothetical protein
MHTQATATHPGMAEGGPWTLDLVAGDPAAAGFTRLAVDAAGAWTLQAPTGETTGGTGLSCQVQAVLTTPQAYLLDLLAKPAPL